MWHKFLDTVGGEEVLGKLWQRLLPIQDGRINPKTE
jgi:hypothetical protein